MSEHLNIESEPIDAALCGNAARQGPVEELAGSVDALEITHVCTGQVWPRLESTD